MKYFLIILLCTVARLSFSQYNLPGIKGYYAFTNDVGVSPSYFQHSGSTNLLINYSEYDVATNTGAYKTFVLSQPFHKEKLQFDIGLIGWERNGKHTYAEVKTGLVTGQQGGSAYISYGMGYRRDLVKDKLSLRLGVGIFYTGMTQQLGYMDNQNKVIDLLDREYSNKIETHNSNHSTTYDDAASIDIYQKYKCFGLKPKIGFELPVGKNQNYCARLNVGYNFVFADINRFRFKQHNTGYDANPPSNTETGTKHGYSASDPRLNYHFASQSNATSPFGMNGLFVNLEVVLKTGKVY